MAHIPPVRRSFRPTPVGWLVIAYILTVLVVSLWFVTGARAAEVQREAYTHRLRIMREAQAAWGVAAPSATFAAQIAQESAYRDDARSHVGAQGLAQFMPATASWIAEVYPALKPADVFSAAWAIRALTRYDRHLWERIAAADGCERMAFTLAAYNGGLGWVNRRKRASPDPLRCLDATCDINPGISAANQRENAAYPVRILRRHEPRYVVAGFGRGACG